MPVWKQAAVRLHHGEQMSAPRFELSWMAACSLGAATRRLVMCGAPLRGDAAMTHDGAGRAVAVSNPLLSSSYNPPFRLCIIM